MAEGSWIRINATEVHLDARTVNAIIRQELEKRAVTVTQKPELRKQIGEVYIQAVTPFVPMRPEDKGGGQLRGSGRATDDGRVYWTAINKRGDNYAGYVFDPDETRWPDGEYLKPSTKFTYPRWTEMVQPGTPAYDAFVNNIAPIIREAFAKNE